MWTVLTLLEAQLRECLCECICVVLSEIVLLGLSQLLCKSLITEALRPENGLIKGPDQNPPEVGSPVHCYFTQYTHQRTDAGANK